MHMVISHFECLDVFEDREVKVSYLLHTKYARPSNVMFKIKKRIIYQTRLSCGPDALDFGMTNLMVVEGRPYDAILLKLMIGKDQTKIFLKIGSSTNLAQISTVCSLT